MQHFARSLLLALQFFTRIPLPASWARWAGFSTARMRAALVHMPAIGWLTGGLAAAVFAAALQLWATAPMLRAAPALLMMLASLLSTAATVWLTGGLHEDGLADVADALLGSATPARALQIMKDPCVGSYAVLVLGLFLLLKACLLAALALLQPRALLVMLVAAHVLSRFFPLVLANRLPHVALEDQSKTRQMAGVIGNLPLWPAVLWCLPLVGVCWLPQSDGSLLLIGSAAGAGAVAAWCMGGWFRRRLEGFTGDCLGATQQVCELACYAAALTVLSRTLAP